MGTLENDMELDIATAHSRLAKRWKNRTTTWRSLVDRCRETRRTGETAAEYARMSREEQSAVKDVGGFVGGYLNGGVRKTSAVLYRTLATLDIDFGTADVWDDFTLQFDFAAMLYSTHKHSPQAPRYRLVFPLSRHVTAQEYEPLCRLVASFLGIDMFDTSTYELARLFYWPSTSRGAEYVFRVQDGPAADVDGLLSMYRDFRDVSEWPVSSREGDAIRHEMRKAGDPLEKPGLIGAFCRAYTIEEAIDAFLPDAYERTAHEGRYTYRLGSVAGGLVCYDHKFAYSHHETDPASRRLCNAFDLVRIHLFGAEDEGSRADDVTRLPSCQKMQELAAKDKAVRRLLARERMESLVTDFGDISADVPGDKPGKDDPDEGWTERLDYDKKGVLRPSAANYEAIMLHDPAFRAVRFDLFGQCDRIEAADSPFRGTHAPWEVDDVSLAKMCAYVEKVHGLKTSVNVLVDKMLRPTATARAFHSVQDYILGERWDGVPRLETLFIDYLGAEDTPIVRAMTRKWMAAAVKRAFEIDPQTEAGVKFDHIIVFYGEQGTGKSTMAETLAAKWHGSISLTDSKKEQGEAFQKAWIVEVPEFKGVKNADTDTVKDLISRCSDDFRAAYARQRTSNARHSVLMGSTNNRYFLKDVTGNRRFWIIPVKGARPVYEWRDELRAVVGQVWAEAYQVYKKGEPLFLTKEQEKEAAAIAEGFTEAGGDPLRDYLADWLDIPLPADWEAYEPKKRRDYFMYYDPLQATGSVTRDEVTICEIINECSYPGLRKYSPQTIGGILKSLGWEYVSGLKRVRGYRGKDGKNKKSSYYKRPESHEGPDDEGDI